MKIEIAVSEIRETVETYNLYGDATMNVGEVSAVVQFAYDEEKGLPPEITIICGDELDVYADTFEDLNVRDIIKQAVDEMFGTGNLIEPGYVFETEIS